MKKILLCLFLLILSAIAGDYKVRPGDTLSKIAQFQLGDASRWKEIADINDIEKPYTVKSGQTLVLPDKGEDDHESVEEILNAPKSEPESDSSIPENITWQLISITSFVSWIFWSICLKAGCWFSLVEISWKKSFLFPLFMILGILMITAIAYFTVGPNSSKALPWLGIISFIALAATVVFLKRYFDCKWRSILTILVMTSVLANLLSLLTMLALSYAIPNIDAVRQLFSFFQK